MADEHPEPEEIQLAREENWGDLARRGRDAWNRGMAWLMDQPENERPKSVSFSPPPIRNFAGFIFPPGFLFNGAKFTGNANFEDAEFRGDANFDGAAFLANANFEDATFHGSANFNRAQFRGSADFEGATFGSDAGFAAANVIGGAATYRRAEFCGKADFAGGTFRDSQAIFDDAKFSGDVDFSHRQFKNGSFLDVQFMGLVNFSGAVFEEEAIFDGARFKANVDFVTAQFGRVASFQRVVFTQFCRFFDVNFGKWAGFIGATFEQNVSFQLSKFGEAALFEGTNFMRDSDFTGAVFDGFTVFDLCNFVQPPAFGATTFSHSPSFAQANFQFHMSPASQAQYRHLKRLAAEAHDHRAELDLFALESKAGRAARTWRSPKHWVELILGRVYECTSDYGRSVIRPLFGLLLTFLFGLVGFQSLLGLHWRVWDWSEAALVASASSLLPFAGQTFVGRKVMEEGLCWDESLHCLARVYRISAVEGFFAVVFLFLLVVGIRNLFRIK